MKFIGSVGSILLIGGCISDLVFPSTLCAQQHRAVETMFDSTMSFDLASVIRPWQPSEWSLVGDGYRFAVDSAIRYRGPFSLRISRPATDTTRPWGYAAIAEPVSVRALRGHVVRLSGRIRSENVRHGSAGLWIRMDAKDAGFIRNGLVVDSVVSGTMPWTEASVLITVDSTAEQIFFGAALTGNGAAWFDDLALFIDDSLYQPVVAADPTSDERAWLRANVIPLLSTNPSASRNDLRPLERTLRDARIVLLGEGTHGTSEFARLKHRIIAMLTEDDGFTSVAIEANQPEVRALNDYVQNGHGDLDALIHGVWFWTYGTTEFRAFIESLRAMNADGRKRVELFGIDAQIPMVAVDSVRAFILK